MQKYKPYLLAFAGGVATALAVLAPVVSDGVSAEEWIQAALAFMGGSGLTAYRPASKSSNWQGDA